MADETKITSGSLIPAEKSQRHQRLQSPRREARSCGRHHARQGERPGRATPSCRFGGCLGIGDKHWPLPWSSLNYDTSKDGFVVDLDKEEAREGTELRFPTTFRWTPDYGRIVDRYYNAPSYWS